MLMVVNASKPPRSVTEKLTVMTEVTSLDVKVKSLPAHGVFLASLLSMKYFFAVFLRMKQNISLVAVSTYEVRAYFSMREKMA